MRVGNGVAKFVTENIGEAGVVAREEIAQLKKRNPWDADFTAAPVPMPAICNASRHKNDRHIFQSSVPKTIAAQLTRNL